MISDDSAARTSECPGGWADQAQARAAAAGSAAVVTVRTAPDADCDGYDVFVNETIVDAEVLRPLVAMLNGSPPGAGAVPRRQRLAEAIIKAAGLVRHQIEGFDAFMDAYLPRIIHENSTVVVDSETSRRRHVLEFGPVAVHGPAVKEVNGAVHAVYPHECRMRNLAYVCSVVCDVRYTCWDISGETKERLARRGNSCAGLALVDARVSRETLICQVPCMLRSRHCHLRQAGPHMMDECPLQPGGTFVINGSDKVVISQEKMRPNHPFVFAERQGGAGGAARCSHVCEVRSCHESKMRSTSTLYLSLSGADARQRQIQHGPTRIAVGIPFIEARGGVPLFVLYRLLGVPTAEAMAALVLEHNPRSVCGAAVCEDPEFEALLWAVLADDAERYGALSRADLCNWVGREGTRHSVREKRIRAVEHILCNEVLPHVGLDRSPATALRKAVHLSAYVQRLLAVRLGRVPPDDRDHNANKRIDTAGPLLAAQFRAQFRALVKGAARRMHRNAEAGRAINVAEAVDHKRVTASLKYAMSTGNWGPQKGGSSLTGVAQVHARITHPATLSNLRRVNTHIAKEGKLPKVRQLHESHWGILCPMETPEGAGCGLIKNLALGCHIRVGYDPRVVTDALAAHCAAPDAGGFTPWAPGPYAPLLAFGGGEEQPPLPAEGEGAARLGERGSDRERRRQRQRAAAARALLEGLVRARARAVGGAPPAGAAVVVNGVIEGYAARPDALARRLRELRRGEVLPFDTAIVYRPAARVLHVHVDAGCCLRPLLRVAGLPAVPALVQRLSDTPVLLVQQLLRAGALEYVCKEEEETLRVAVDPADLLDPAEHSAADAEPFTHVEVHPSLLLGACASLIPFPEFNQGPRNMYQAAMEKQAQAVPSLNAALRADTMSHMLWYPQVPLVHTFTEEVLQVTALPRGQNLMMAVLSFTGENQEDGFIFNQSAVERGLFRTTVFRTYRDEEKSRGSDVARIERPAGGADAVPCRGLRKANYSKLNPDGFVDPGTEVVPGDVLIGKTVLTEEMHDPEAEATGPRGQGQGQGQGQDQHRQRQSPSSSKTVKRDCSTILRSNEPAVVDRVIETRNREGSRCVKVVTRAVRCPEIGDKFCARGGQKGTIGMVYRTEDMPFTLRGEVPDIIVNPHGIPSRMTVGMMLEALLGKTAARAGRWEDGTPHRGIAVEDIAAEALRYGLTPYGKERMINPHTGECIDALVFFAPIHYEKLKHMAIDKIHARGRGPKQLLTQQPVEGRSRDGGLRLGEMERDCMIAHGVAQFLQERLCDQSDPYIAHVCRRCGLLAEPARPRHARLPGMVLRAGRPYCRNCRRHDTVAEIKMPYACKLLAQELMACNIALRFRIEDYAGVRRRHGARSPPASPRGTAGGGGGGGGGEQPHRLLSVVERWPALAPPAPCPGSPSPAAPPAQRVAEPRGTSPPEGAPPPAAIFRTPPTPRGRKRKSAVGNGRGVESPAAAEQKRPRT